MPELPEVETTLRGIEGSVVGRKVVDVIVRNSRLRWPVPADIAERVRGRQVLSLSRRGKYLLWHFESGHLLVHLGMSGRLKIIDEREEPQRHDHVDIKLDSGKAIRFTDPRRFGAVLWASGDMEQLNNHKLLVALGPEPLGDLFTGDYLFARAKKRKVPVKTFIMDSKVVVGVGNIYANEALFRSGIHPLREVGSISRKRLSALVEDIQRVLIQAIKAGGTTLKDFLNSEGKPGYFKQELQVYGRSGEPCTICHTTLKEVRLAQRSTVFCRKCQT